MPSIEITCKYERCTLGKDGGRKVFHGTASGMYCCHKHGTYQRRLDKRKERDFEYKHER